MTTAKQTQEFKDYLKTLTKEQKTQELLNDCKTLSDDAIMKKWGCGKSALCKAKTDLKITGLKRGRKKIFYFLD